jgi:hypothetical protein
VVAVASVVAYGFGACLMPRLVRIPSDLPVVRVPLHAAPPRRRPFTCTRGIRGQPHVVRKLDARHVVATTAPAPGRARPSSAQPAGVVIPTGAP